MTGRCQPAEMCMTDSLEPNDSTMSATAIMTGNYQGLWVCRSDDDYFSFTASAGDQVRFVLEFLVNEGEVEATILDSTGMPVANSQPNSSGAVVDYNVMTGGTFYLKVEMSRDSGTVVGNAYEIEATIGTAPSSCTLDRFEPNDASGAAASVSAMSYANLFSCSTDDDYYAIDLMNGDVITINITFDHSEGDIDLRLYQPGSFSAVADSVTFMAPEVITNYRVTTAGTHLIKISQYLDAGTFTGNSYTMDISIR